MLQERVSPVWPALIEVDQTQLAEGGLVSAIQLQDIRVLDFGLIDFARLEIFIGPIEMPPLRARQGDVALLAQHFVRKFAAAHGKPVLRLMPRALELLEAFDWPGNVRQLENCLEQAVVLCQGDRIDDGDLSLGADSQADSEKERSGAGRELPPGLTLQELEQRYILQTLVRMGQNRTRTAAALGISLRGLQYKLKSYRQESL